MGLWLTDRTKGLTAWLRIFSEVASYSLSGCAEITCFSELLLPWAVFFKQLLLWASPLFVLSRYFFSLTLPLSELHLSANSPLHLWANSLSFWGLFRSNLFIPFWASSSLCYFSGPIFRWARWRTSSLTSSSLSNFLSDHLADWVPADWVPEFHSSRRTC